MHPAPGRFQALLLITATSLVTVTSTGKALKLGGFEVEPKLWNKQCLGVHFKVASFNGCCP